MRRLLGLATLVASALCAQSVDTIPFRAVLLTSNEVPSVDLAANGSVTLWVHVVRDAAGAIVSGSVDFNARYSFPTAVTLTGFHIHRGTAGNNGPVVINSGLTTTANAGPTGTLSLQGEVKPDNAAGLSALNDMIANPAGFYVNIHNSDNPGGVMRGQVQPASMFVFSSLMDATKQNPPIAGLTATAVGTFIIIASTATDGSITSAEVWFDVNYTGFPDGTTFTGLHVHKGGLADNGPVVIPSGLAGPVTAGAGGTGNLRFQAEVPMTNASEVSALYGVINNPGGYYINLHTPTNPGGAIRSQLRDTDRSVYQVTLLPSNELPAVALNGSAPSQFLLHTIRGNDGKIQAGVAFFDVNYRFPAGVVLRGMHIHDGDAATNGPVRIDSGLGAANAITSADGFGNMFRLATVSSTTALATANSLVGSPDKQYFNIHTVDNPGGAMRSQLGPTGVAPVVTAIISSVDDVHRLTVGQLGLMSIFGANLLRTPGDWTGFDSSAPQNFNGVNITIGPKNAAILWLGRVPTAVPTDFIVAQAPPDIDPGTYPVVVTTSAGSSSPVNVAVDVVAPALYFDTNGGVAFRVADYSQITAANPAKSGEWIAFLSTGLGQTTPALALGQLAGSGNATATPTVMIGNKSATVQMSLAFPGLAGYYWTVVTVPDGISGLDNVVLTIGGKDSNTVAISVQ